MKKKIIFFVLLFLFLATFVNNVGAEFIEKKIDVGFNKDLRVIVDGKQLPNIDDKGEKVEVFMYKGMVYAPVNSIGKVLEKNVEWNGKESILYIGQ